MSDLPDSVQKALNGFDATRVSVEDMKHLYVYSKLLDGTYPIEYAREYTHPRIENPRYNNGVEEISPRFFGIEVAPELHPEAVESFGIYLMSEIDRVFLPSNLEYDDGGYPNGEGLREIARVIIWLDIARLDRLPVTDASTLRMVLNVEYKRKL